MIHICVSETKIIIISDSSQIQLYKYQDKLVIYSQEYYNFSINLMRMWDECAQSFSPSINQSINQSIID